MGIENVDLIIDELYDICMRYETSLSVYYSVDYLKEFLDYHEIKKRGISLTETKTDFYEALKDVCGDGLCQEIGEKLVAGFGFPKRITQPDDISLIKKEMEEDEGISPFYIVFDIMFCEYNGFTLCFISGTNN